MTTTPSIPQQMRARIRRYMLTVISMLAGAVVVLVLLGFLARTIFASDETSALVIAIAAPLMMLGVVVSSWFLVAKYWRCPGCEKNVFMTVSWNMSLFARSASRTCPQCGVELFTIQGQRRGLRILLIMVAIGAATGVITAAISAASVKKTTVPQQTEAVAEPTRPPP